MENLFSQMDEGMRRMMKRYQLKPNNTLAGWDLVDKQKDKVLATFYDDNLAHDVIWHLINKK